MTGTNGFLITKEVQQGRMGWPPPKEEFRDSVPCTISSSPCTANSKNGWKTAQLSDRPYRLPLFPLSLLLRLELLLLPIDITASSLHMVIPLLDRLLGFSNALARGAATRGSPTWIPAVCRLSARCPLAALFSWFGIPSASRARLLRLLPRHFRSQESTLDFRYTCSLVRSCAADKFGLR